MLALLTQDQPEALSDLPLLLASGLQGASEHGLGPPALLTIRERGLRQGEQRRPAPPRAVPRQPQRTPRGSRRRGLQCR